MALNLIDWLAIVMGLWMALRGAIFLLFPKETRKWVAIMKAKCRRGNFLNYLRVLLFVLFLIAMYIVLQNASIAQFLASAAAVVLFVGILMASAPDMLDNMLKLILKKTAVWYCWAALIFLALGLIALYFVFISL